MNNFFFWIHFWLKIGYHSNFNPECNRENGFINQLFTELGNNGSKYFWFFFTLSRAPGGCLQYFTGASGNILSFNAGDNGALIDNLLYNICIRREAGKCSANFYLEHHHDYDSMSPLDRLNTKIQIKTNKSSVLQMLYPLGFDFCRNKKSFTKMLLSINYRNFEIFFSWKKTDIS